jgi:hypothetical protein
MIGIMGVGDDAEPDKRLFSDRSGTVESSRGKSSQRRENKFTPRPPRRFTPKRTIYIGLTFHNLPGTAAVVQLCHS